MAEISSGTTVMSPYVNSSVDNSSAEDYYKDPVVLWNPLKIILFIVFCLVFVLGVVGNGIVIWVAGFRMKKTVITVWYLNLAVADFLCTTLLPFYVTTYVMDGLWLFGHFMCKFHGFCQVLTMAASVYILVVISVDRCICVVFPVWAQNHRNVSRASLLSLGVWMFALLLSSPFFDFMDTTAGKYNVCVGFSFSKMTLLYLVLFTQFLLGFVVPFITIISCNGIIIHHLKRNRSMSGRTGRPFKIIAAVITVFFLCWAPYHILSLIVVAYLMEITWHTDEYNQTLGHALIIGIPLVTSLTFLNSCLNPLLYVFIGQDFKNMRKSVLKVLETAFTE